MSMTNAERAKAYYWRHRERLLEEAKSPEKRAAAAERQQQYRLRHPERAKQAQRNADAKRDHAQRSKKWREANSEKRLEYNAKNLARACARENKRRAKKQQAVPAWANEEAISELYELAAVRGMDVDHIVPLVSKRVCGLHVEANLRLLPSVENRSKNNRWWPDMFEEKGDL